MAVNEHYFPKDKVSDERLRQAVQILTTEHFTLQTGRASTTAEAMGRISIFLTSTSSSLIAIAFIGQAANMGQPFRVFTLILLPTLLLLGLFTLGRATQSASEDGLYLSGINRIRHFYVEVVPELKDYFVLSTHDDWQGRMVSAGIPWSRWQPLFGAPTMVAVINAILAGTLIGLLASWLVDWPMPFAAALGLLGGVLLLAAELRYGMARIARTRRRAPLFPTPKA